MTPDNFVELYSGPEVGKIALIKSLLEAHNIPFYCPFERAESFAFWQHGLARRYSIYIAPKDQERALELLHELLPNYQDAPPPRPFVLWLIRAFLLLTVSTLLISGIVSFIGLIAR